MLMANADSTPPMFAQVAEEFVEAAWAGQAYADELREKTRADSEEAARERKRDWAATRRILARLRRVQGIEERECACGCGRMFPVEYSPKGGRPRIYATSLCRWQAWWRSRRGG